MNSSFHIILTLGWIVYGLLHSIMASVSFKLWVQHLMGIYYRYYRLIYSLFAAVTLILLLIYQFSGVSEFLFKPSLVLKIAGIALALAGAVVMTACILKYFVNLSGIDVFLKKKPQPVLEKNGLHNYVRHPLYAGTLLFIWSLFLLFPLLSNLIACVVITIYTLVGIKIEEQKLLAEFGDTYRSYASSTPMLIPGIRKRRQAP